MKKAILFGASGFIGSCLLADLLENKDYELVSVVVRKTLGFSHPKLRELIGDYSSLHLLEGKIDADEVFITLGTTRAKTPDKAQYYQVDHDYPVGAAKMAREAGVKSVLVVTAVGANANSGIFYTRTKGEIERDIIALNFEYTCIFRPSMIMGERKENRRFEKTLIKVWVFINPLLTGKSLSKYRGITGQHVATAMMNAAKNQKEKVKIFHWQKMMEM
ncbi:NAD(P)H-binding protein [Mucilaginibacter sp.]|uniref:NAD(P)H-binding protein n=1 Tax=Mucilaginibacter sp. TaxID=1882438 RepID=UPI0025D19132|nr:NAD(P)H-binding protein [Mucilaginibacter sp.]